jgi:Zn-dependent membrane protease YugP
MFAIAIVTIFAALLLGIWAQSRISSAYAKWSRVPSRSGNHRSRSRPIRIEGGGHKYVRIVAIKGH